jgi:hypothetical protein
MSSNSKIQIKDLNPSPDEVLTFEKEKIEIVTYLENESKRTI